MVSDVLAKPPSLAVRRVTHDKLLLFGDSITELSSDIFSLSFALTPALQQHYVRKLSVVARGYGGYTSEHLRHVLSPTMCAETAAGETIRLLVIEIGTNDASALDIQTVTVARYTENMDFIIRTARSAGAERIVVVGPGPIDEKLLGSPQNNSTLRNREYSNAAKAVAEKHGVPFIDMWHGMLHAVGWKDGEPVPGSPGHDDRGLDRYLTDGVHFTGEGYRFWYDRLLAVIRYEFPELRPERLPMVLPGLFDIDRHGLPDSLWQEPKV